MGLLIVSQPGTVIAVADPTDTPLPLAVQGWGGAASMKSIITELNVGRQSGTQFVHSLKDSIYAYSFGERIGALRIAGLSFASLCGTDATSGVEAVLNYYNQYRASSAGAPVTVAIGTSAAGRLRGFLTQLNLSIARPEARLAQFALDFVTLPNS